MTILSALIAATLAVVAYSLWVRRHTWWSRWESAASFAIAVEGCALVLMSPWASATLAPALYHVARRWNVQHLLGHLCLIVAIAAIIYHCLLRLADTRQARALFRRQVTTPVRFGAVLLVAVFVVADTEHHPDLFAAHVGDAWLAAYWLVLGVLVLYLSGYGGRLLLIMRSDPRARATADLFLVSAAFGSAAAVIQLSTAWAGIDVSLPVWFCSCLAMGIFSYGSARSWQAKAAWFNGSTGSAGFPGFTA